MAGRRARLSIIPVVVIAAVALAVRPVVVDQLLPSIAGQGMTVAYQGVVQALGLLIAVAVLAVTFGLTDRASRGYWGIGQPAAPARRVRWLGIREGVSWRRLGAVMLGWISVLLAGFLYLGLSDRLTGRVSPVVLLLAVVFAIINAVTEEAVFRLSLVSSLHGVVSDRVILPLGAGIFGAVHYVGVPGGPVGVVMAAFLGWFLTKSILETRGVFWAILIHFVQDVIIFAMLFHVV